MTNFRIRLGGAGVRVVDYLLSTHQDGVVTTADFLLAIMEIDANADWQYLHLHTGGPDRLRDWHGSSREAVQPVQWKGLRLTDAVIDALRTADEVVAIYNLSLLPLPLLAICLVAVPDSDARTMITATSGCTASDVLRKLSEDVLDVELEGLLALPSLTRHASKEDSAGFRVGNSSQSPLPPPPTADSQPIQLPPPPPASDWATLFGSPPPPGGRPRASSVDDRQRWPVSVGWLGKVRRIQFGTFGDRARLALLSVPFVIAASYFTFEFLSSVTTAEARTTPIPLRESEILHPFDMDGWVIDDVLTEPDQFRSWQLSEASLLRDIYGELVEDEYQMLAYRPDFSGDLAIRLLLNGSHTYSEAAIDPGYDLQEDLGFDLHYAEDVLDYGPGWVEYEGDAVKGPVLIKLRLAVQEADSKAARAQFFSLFERQYDLVESRETIALEFVDLDPMRARMVAEALPMAFGLAALGTLLSFVRDRSLWLRLRRLTSRRHDFTSGAISDVSHRARTTRRQDQIESAALTCVVASILVIVLMAPTRQLSSALLGAALFAVAELARRAVIARSGRGGSGHERYSVTGGVVAGAAGLLIAALGLWVVETASAVRLFGLSNTSPDVVERVRNSLVMTGLLILAASTLPVRVNRIVTRRPRTDRPGRVLLLRSFTDDRLRLQAGRSLSDSVFRRLSQSRWRRFEEQLVDLVARYGSVSAVDEPAKPSRSLGATRIRLSGSGWLDKVVAHARASDVVVVIAGRSEGLLLEIQALRDFGLLHKVVFVVPPVDDEECSRRLALAASILAGSPREIQVPHQRSAVAFRCRVDGEIEIVQVSTSRDRSSYDSAIAENFPAAIRSNPSTSSPSPPAASETLVVPGPAREWANAPGKTKQPRLPWYLQGGVVMLLGSSILGGCVAVLEQWSDIPEVEANTFAYGVAPGSARALSDGSVALAGLDEVWALELTANGDVVADRADAPNAARMAADSDHFYTADVDGGLTSTRRTGGSPVWSVNTGEWNEQVVVTDGFLVLSQPMADAVEVRDKRTGQLLTRSILEGAPWGLSYLGDHLVLVTLANLDAVVELDVRSGRILATHRVLPGPRDIATSPGGFVISSMVGDGVTILDGSGGDGHRRRLPGAIHPAIAVVDDMIVVSQAGLDGNLAFLTLQGESIGTAQVGRRNITSLAPFSSGGLIVVYDDQTADLVSAQSLEDARLTMAGDGD